MQKKLLLILLCLITVITVVACSPNNEDVTIPSESVETTPPTEEQTEPPTTIPVHEHNYTETKTEPNCVEAGLVTYVCDCGHKYEDIIPALGHDYETKTIDPTYTTTGYDEHICKVCQHTYQDNETDKIPHEHKYKEKVTKPTCTETGYTTHTCEICGYKYSDSKVEATGHKYETETVKPTYTEKGYDVHKCSQCTTSYKDNYTDVIPHDCDYKETVTQSTCTEKGYTTYTCKLCNKSHKDNYQDLTPHNYETKTVAPTCVAKGYDLHTCKVCKHEYKDNETEKIEHTYEEKVVAPTCTEGGYTKHVCKMCDKSHKDNETKALGHDYVTETVKPTAKEKGYDIHTCSRCKDSYKDNYTDPVVTYKEVNETVYATTDVNIRKGPSTDFEKLGSLSKGESITRVGIGDNGWSKVMYNNEVAYMFSDYLTTEKPPVISENGYPKTYSDSTCSITITKEWYKNAYVYAAHIKFSNYKRLGTECANGKYNNGYETTSHAAKRIGAIFAVNGCYSSPNLDYTVVRSGKIWNGSGRATFWCPAVYSSHNGKLVSAWDGSWSTPGISGGQIDQLVADGLVTDTFCFGPPSMCNGEIAKSSDTSRAQRTFIGTNGNAGDIWICVSDGRYNDGKSAGLTFKEAAEYLKEKGCTFCVHLDGGGSSTMYFNGNVLNAAKGGQRAVVDFLYFK